MIMNNLCPCGSQRLADDCCLAIISGKREAKTALELMRSRYVAFTIGDGGYLMQSHHQKTRPAKERSKIESWAKSVHWMGLQVLTSQGGLANDYTGYVEFRALYLENAQLQQIHENSFFKKEQGKWFYYSGVHKL